LRILEQSLSIALILAGDKTDEVLAMIEGKDTGPDESGRWAHKLSKVVDLHSIQSKVAKLGVRKILQEG